MLISVWWNPFSWGADILDGIVSVIYGILLTFDCIIYSFISYIYQLFLVLANGQQGLIDESFVGDFVGRIYIILGVIMLFLISYSLLKSMINVDEATKGKKSPINIIKDVIISIVLIALMPSIFSFAFQLQNSLLINNTIGKIIVGNHGSAEDAQDTVRMGGYTMAEGVFGAFLHANEGYCNSKAEEEVLTGADGKPCTPIQINNTTTFGDLWVRAKEATTFWVLSETGPKILSGEVSYYFLVCPLAGIYVLFVLMSYSLDMAIRLVKLSVFEVMAPIPILSRLIPNEQGKKVFSNWIKATVSTFVEVFIRIAILYFAIFLIKNVTGSIGRILGTAFSGSARLDICLLAEALIIIAILIFVKQAPDIIKEITGLDSKKHSKGLMSGLGMMAAVIGGGATAAIRSYTADKSNPELAGKNHLGRALTAGLSAGARGLFEGSKVSKFGDITKQTGKAASGALASRAKIEAAGGLKGYLTQQLADTKARYQDWQGGSNEAIKSEKAASDKLLKVVSNVKATAEDYIDKHASEYFTDAAVQDSYNKYSKQLKEAKTAEEKQAAQAELDKINKDHLMQRLDVIKAKSEDMNLQAEERAYYVNLYNQSRKTEVDNFATTVQAHTGADKERATVNEELKTLQELIKENKASLAVQNLIKGNGEFKLEAFKQELTTENAGKYLKATKDAADYANIAVQRQLNDIERRAERHKATPNGGNGGKNS